MERLAAWLVCVALGASLTAPRAAFAEDPTALTLAQPAPFAGILLDEATAVSWGHLRVELDYVKAQLENRDRLLLETSEQLVAVQSQLADRMREVVDSVCTESLWERADFTVGLVLGIAGTALLVWASVRLVQAS